MTGSVVVSPTRPPPRRCPAKPHSTPASNAMWSRVAARPCSKSKPATPIEIALLEGGQPVEVVAFGRNKKGDLPALGLEEAWQAGRPAADPGRRQRGRRARALRPVPPWSRHRPHRRRAAVRSRCAGRRDDRGRGRAAGDAGHRGAGRSPCWCGIRRRRPTCSCSFAAPIPRLRGRAQVARAAGRAAPRHPHQYRERAELRGQGRRIHPDHRHCRTAVLGLPGLQPARARQGQCARPRLDHDAHDDGARLSEAGSVLEVLRPRPQRSGRGGAGHRRPARHVQSRVHGALLRGHWATSVIKNCSDNFNEALAPYEVGNYRGWPAINFFFNTNVDAHNNIWSDEPWSRPGDYVLMRALTDLVCGTSSCPADIDRLERLASLRDTSPRLPQGHSLQARNRIPHDPRTTRCSSPKSRASIRGPRSSRARSPSTKATGCRRASPRAEPSTSTGPAARAW